MNWFNGQLEVTYKSGVKGVFHDVTFAKACELAEALSEELTDAIYIPSACSVI